MGSWGVRSVVEFRVLPGMGPGVVVVEEEGEEDTVPEKTHETLLSARPVG